MHHLKANLDGFTDLSDTEQHQIAGLLWVNNISGRYQHKARKDAFTLYCRAKEQMFGRGRFEEINMKLGLFTASNNWSITLGQTKAYGLADKAKQIIQEYLTRKGTDELTNLVNFQGDAIRNRSNGILSRDMKGQTAETRAKISWSVPVNVPLVRKGIETLKAWKDHFFYGDTAPTINLFPGIEAIPSEQLEGWIQRRLEQLQKIDVLAHNTLLPLGEIPQQYIEVDSGRLFGVGFSLQNAARDVKRIAFSGCWEYDFENCHFSILSQLAHKAGHRCGAIRGYLANKAEYRNRIAADVGITVEQVKKCLLALLYGARESTSPRCAIPEEIGGESGGMFFQHELVRLLMADIEAGRAAVIGAAEVSRGKVCNAMGKWIAADSGPEKVLAHILQGMEARMLNIACDLYGRSLVLLQHDGFTARDRLNVAGIEAEIERQTGLVMPIEEKQLQGLL